MNASKENTIVKERGLPALFLGTKLCKHLSTAMDENFFNLLFIRR